MLESVRRAMELAAMTGVTRFRAADVLRENEKDMAAALAALIEAGDIGPADIRRDLCPPDLLAAAQAKAAALKVAEGERERELAALATRLAAQRFPELARDEHGAWVGKDAFPFWKDFAVAPARGSPRRTTATPRNGTASSA